jgi:DNA replication regulator DPB11
MSICVSGFTGVDLLHVTKVIKLMGIVSHRYLHLCRFTETHIGATYEEYLVAGRSLLLCKATHPNKEKLDFATENGVAVVTEQWLWASLEHGVKQEFKEYELGNETPTVAVDYQPQKSRSRSLGKGKLLVKPER